MRVSKASFACVGLLTVAMATSCAPAPSTAPAQVTSTLDYPGYNTLAELCGSATLVVAGTPLARSVRNINILSEDQGGTPEQNPALGTDEVAPGSFEVQTVTAFKVDEVISGGSSNKGDLIEVGQPGGFFEGVDYIAEQYAFNTGERYLLFLVEFDGSPANLLNPSQAAYEVTGDGVISGASSASLANDLDGKVLSSDLCS